jgi:hypothetical protein
LLSFYGLPHGIVKISLENLCYILYTISVTLARQPTGGLGDRVRIR